MVDTVDRTGVIDGINIICSESYVYWTVHHCDS